MAEARTRITENPFYVLGLAPDATRQEIEREGQKLLGMLELGLGAAAEYKTPLGRELRTQDLVRRAVAELRDPDRRLVHELWACLPAELVVELGEERSDEVGWPDAKRLLGWAAE